MNTHRKDSCFYHINHKAGATTGKGEAIIVLEGKENRCVGGPTRPSMLLEIAIMERRRRHPQSDETLQLTLQLTASVRQAKLERVRLRLSDSVFIYMKYH